MSLLDLVSEESSATVREDELASMTTDVDRARAAAIIRRIDPRFIEVMGERRIAIILGVEVGVAAGKLSVALLAAEENLHLTMVDDYASGSERGAAYRETGDQHAFVSKTDQLVAMRTSRRRVVRYGKGRTRMIVMSSTNAAREVKDEAYDFVFLDADHSVEGVRADLAAWWSKIIPGGWLCGHDYGGYVIVSGEPRYFGVKEAVDEWVEAEGLTLEIDVDDTWFVKKKKIS